MAVDAGWETKGKATANGFDVRVELESMLERDLLGPWDGPTEELPPGTTPGERYLLGKLVPRRVFMEESADLPDEAAEDDDVEDRPELVDSPGLDLEVDSGGDPPTAAAIRGRAMAASSLGLAFSVPGDLEAVIVEASWGRYDRSPSETQMTETGRPRVVWRRVPAGGSVEVPVGQEGKGNAVPDGEQEQVELRWRVRLRDGRRLVEVFLVNAQPLRAELLDRDRIFQVTLTVTSTEGQTAVFLGHNDPDFPEVHRERDEELRLLALQHRLQRLYATGRQCAVDADVRDGDARAWRLRTTNSSDDQLSGSRGEHGCGRGSGGHAGARA